MATKPPKRPLKTQGEKPKWQDGENSIQEYSELNIRRSDGVTDTLVVLRLKGSQNWQGFFYPNNGAEVITLGNEKMNAMARKNNAKLSFTQSSPSKRTMQNRLLRAYNAGKREI